MANVTLRPSGSSEIPSLPPLSHIVSTLIEFLLSLLLRLLLRRLLRLSSHPQINLLPFVRFFSPKEKRIIE